MSERRGRRPESPLGSKVQFSVLLTPEEVAALEVRYGSVRKGLRAWLATITHEEAVEAVPPLPATVKGLTVEPAAASVAPVPIQPAPHPRARALCPRCTRIGVAACAACRQPGRV